MNAGGGYCLHLVSHRGKPCGAFSFRCWVSTHRCIGEWTWSNQIVLDKPHVTNWPLGLMHPISHRKLLLTKLTKLTTWRKVNKRILPCSAIASTNKKGKPTEIFNCSQYKFPSPSADSSGSGKFPLVQKSKHTSPLKPPSWDAPKAIQQNLENLQLLKVVVVPLTWVLKFAQK